LRIKKYSTRYRQTRLERKKVEVNEVLGRSGHGKKVVKKRCLEGRMISSEKRGETVEQRSEGIRKAGDAGI